MIAQKPLKPKAQNLRLSFNATSLIGSDDFFIVIGNHQFIREAPCSFIKHFPITPISAGPYNSPLARILMSDERQILHTSSHDLALNVIIENTIWDIL